MVFECLAFHSIRNHLYFTELFDLTPEQRVVEDCIHHDIVWEVAYMCLWAIDSPDMIRTFHMDRPTVTTAREMLHMQTDGNTKCLNLKVYIMRYAGM